MKMLEIINKNLFMVIKKYCKKEMKKLIHKEEIGYSLSNKSIRQKSA